MTISKPLFGLAVLSAALLSSASANAATTISGLLAADNTFAAYLGTNAGSLGTQVASGSSFTSPTSLSAATLTAGVTNYLNIVVNNTYTFGGAGPGGLSFVLNLAGTGFQFANGTTTFSSAASNLSYQKASGAPVPGIWTAATGSAQLVTNYAYGNVVGTSDWIDATSNGLNTTTCMTFGCTVDFTVAIMTATAAPAAVPEPATWALMLTGFGMVGYAMRQRARTTVSYA
jgi:hypothetical protein